MGETLAVLNPATEEVLVEQALAGPDEVDAAVDRAAAGPAGVAGRGPH